MKPNKRELKSPSFPWAGLYIHSVEKFSWWVSAIVLDSSAHRTALLMR